jgi:hypothetical protein
MTTKVKLTNVRLSFPKLFEAEQYEGKGPYRYGAAFWVPKTDTALIAQINEAIQTEAKAAWGAKAQAMLAEVLPDKKACCWIDGTRKDAEDYWVLGSYRGQEKGRPLVIDQKKQPLVAADGKPYAGCYVHATVEIYTTGKPNVGIRCGLLGVQFAKDGDAFGGGSPANPDDFAELAEGADAGDLA